MTSPALPNEWIDRLFARLAALYGKHWLDLWADVPMADIKDAWGEALRGCDGEQVRATLEYCSRNLKFPPTAPEFASLAWQLGRKTDQPKITHNPNYDEPADPRVRQAVRQFIDQHRSPIDPKKWARDILRDAEAGTYTLPIGIEFAKEALGLKGKP